MQFLAIMQQDAWSNIGVPSKIEK